VVNELLTRDIDDSSSVNFTLVYDDNGNLTDDGEHYTYEYDAFGRLHPDPMIQSIHPHARKRDILRST
jgi:hypothetical protein